MKLSHFFMPTFKEDPAEAQITSHRLMLRTGMIAQETSGIYTWLPLGQRVLSKVKNIIREEHDEVGAMEIIMPTVQPADLWHESGRYDAYGKEMLRFKDRHERDLLYGPTHEEVVTDIVRRFVKSYRELPLCLYQIQPKFRDEIRPRFGIMRGREFLMKDAYSFDLDVPSGQATYEKMFRVYLRIFARLGVPVIPVRADTGAIGGDLSHEFHVVADTGESALYYDAAFDQVDMRAPDAYEKCKALYAAADELHQPTTCGVPAENLRAARGIEIGHIFFLGHKYSAAMGATVVTAEGVSVPFEMGCYGIGVGRVVGAIIEASHDDQGIIWPVSVAPFEVGIVNLKSGDEGCDRLATDLYEKLQNAGLEMLYDDRKGLSGGVKFASMDLMGLPWQVVIGPKGASTGQVEIKERRTGATQTLSPEDAVAFLHRRVSAARKGGA